MMVPIVNTDELPGDTSRQFEGYHYGAVDVSFFVSATPPGRGPSLHTHPYAEVFVVRHTDIHASGRMETTWLEA
jgi:hypothetical protein